MGFLTAVRNLSGILTTVHNLDFTAEVGFMRESNVAESIKSESKKSYLPCEKSLGVTFLELELCY